MLGHEASVSGGHTAGGTLDSGHPRSVRLERPSWRGQPMRGKRSPLGTFWVWDVSYTPGAITGFTSDTAS